MSRRVTITFDAIDPPTIADFWAAALGYATNDSYGADQSDIAVAEDPDGPGPRLLFLRVPEAKATKNRVHLDVHCGIEPHRRFTRRSSGSNRNGGRGTHISRSGRRSRTSLKSPHGP